MARPLRIQYPGAVYHISHHGYEHQNIFLDDSDYQEFLAILAQTISSYDCILHCYLLLNNEFHLLLETPLGNISESLRHLNITYTARFNHRHRRHGKLLHGRFKSLLINKSANLARLSRIIHLIPAQSMSSKDQSVSTRHSYIFQYPLSSLPGYLETDKRQSFVLYGDVLKVFGGDSEQGRYAYKTQIVQDTINGFSIQDKITDQSIFGDDSFVAWVRNRYQQGSEDKAVLARGRVHQLRSSAEILRVVAEETACQQSDLLSQSNLNRALAMDMLYRFGGMKNAEIGDLMGIDFSTVSQARKRLREKAAADQQVEALRIRIECRFHS